MTAIKEKLRGIVQRVTYHNPDNGWAVLKVAPFDAPSSLETVTVHQTRVFAGATMEFHGVWTQHSKYGRQFKADAAIEKKPATVGALEKYLGSGLIYGVGPVTAKKIVSHFQTDTLEVFDRDIERLLEIPGIAGKKLEKIADAWHRHRMVREVMMFLQGNGISTLFAVRIYKQYGDRAIDIVRDDPYRLAVDFYGIGFFSADQVALKLGFAVDSEKRLRAAVRHVLSAAREQGHCYLGSGQIEATVRELLGFAPGRRLADILAGMEQENQLKTRRLVVGDAGEQSCYYSKSLYYDELFVAEKIGRMSSRKPDQLRQADAWIDAYCERERVNLSKGQRLAVQGVIGSRFSVLTGGPGCGKTTTTLVIVRLLEKLGNRVLLAAPTGRAAQRMTEVIGREAKTLHRLLEWKNGSFQRNEKQLLDCDCLLVDECSMLDISLTASLLKAVPERSRLLFVGDADQLPSVGAGNVLGDIIDSTAVPVFRLTEVFRQAGESKIIRYAHEINKGSGPQIQSPFKRPLLWKEKEDCLFIDSEEATGEQIDFIARVKRAYGINNDRLEGIVTDDNLYRFRTGESMVSGYEPSFTIPEKFKHVDLDKLRAAGTGAEELKAVLARVHPWSTLHYGFGALETVVRAYLEWIPKYHGRGIEIQILSPMTRGSLGTVNLNRVIQAAANPPGPGRPQLQVGEKIFRAGDRVIHRRNNYELGVFNGDLGTVTAIDNSEVGCTVSLLPDGRSVVYRKDDLMQLDLGYAITIHKSQGSEFQAVIMPVLTQHFTMLYRNLIYTGLTRARNLALLVGTRKALAMAVNRRDTSRRQTALRELIVEAAR
jgi:exodeoxyribonuclease V alpha subunit